MKSIRINLVKALAALLGVDVVVESQRPAQHIAPRYRAFVLHPRESNGAIEPMPEGTGAGEGAVSNDGQSITIRWKTLTLGDYLSNNGDVRSTLSALTPAALAKVELYLWLRAMGEVPGSADPLSGGASLAVLVLGG